VVPVDTLPVLPDPEDPPPHAATESKRIPAAA
jgi:hypothetical protein